MRKVLYISPQGTQWKVHWEHESAGTTFENKTDAISHARQMVRELPSGQVSQIKVQKSDGTFQIEWTYGQDPYPPGG